MDVIEAIRKRTSVRKYKDKKIPEDMLMELIEAARLAPSGNNTQPWKFKIISDPDEIELLKDNDIFKQDFVYTAPALILCCADPSKYPSHELDDSNNMRAIRDLGIASQNLVLRATELGLGICYVGWMNKPKVKELLKIPKEYIAPYVITVGYPAEDPVERKKKDIKEILLN